MSTSAPLFVVDDDASVRRAVARLLRSAGYQTLVFDGAAAAQQALADPEVKPPACLILDVRMPEQTGFDLLESLNVSIPVILITGDGGDAITERALRIGAIQVLSKPFDDETLLRAVTLALRD